jgi:hypothetical protein
MHLFLIIKPTRCTNHSNYFRNENLHVSDSSSVHHQEFFNVYTAMVYVIQACRQLASKLPEKLYDKYLCCVYGEKTPDNGQGNCLKRTEFHSKNKFQ